MDIKNYWTKLKYWQKGSYIGFVVAFILIFIFSVWVNFVSSKGPDPYISFYLAFIIMSIVYVIPATILGGFIGFLINKYKRR